MILNNSIDLFLDNVLFLSCCCFDEAVLQGRVSFAESVSRPGDGLCDDGQVFVCLSPVLLQVAPFRLGHSICQTWERGQAGGAWCPDHVPAGGDVMMVYISLTSPEWEVFQRCLIKFMLKWYLNPYLLGKASGSRKARSSSMSWSLILRAFSGLENNNHDLCL